MSVRLSVVQCVPDRQNTHRNWEYIYDVSRTVETDILVFPELMTSGYCYDSADELRSVAVEENNHRLQTLQDIATRSHKIVCVGYAERDGEHCYNSAALLMPDAHQSRTYRKTHLFYKERYVFRDGDSGFFTVYDKEHDCTIGIMICYDWRFPESARSLALLGADLILCPSNLVTHIWRAVMPTRAIENKVYLAVANRYGSEFYGTEEVIFNGQSAIYDVNGSLLAAADATGDAILHTTIHPERTRDKSFNSENDILRDRRPDMYIVR